ncbi:MAG: DUF5518 domain-containing protein [Chloroflexi bacterium]|nr:DUF5518 domain-containing protein [Chloroflexota bacterium]
MVKSAFIGFLVALGMFLPPILHFITAPLGPFVGGYIAGSKVSATTGKAVLIGVLMGLFMIIPIAVVVLGLDIFARGLLSQGMRLALGLTGGLVLVYTAVVGSIGAIIGGHMALK